MTTPITIIIPTHNRCISLQRLLKQLALQTYPLSLMQVVVVANGCTDDTLQMLQRQKMPYELLYTEASSKGPAIARNKGAALASGDLLLFLDDDIDPSTQLVEAHVKAHTSDQHVVIGYLPFPIDRKAGFYKKNLRAWWEQKFHHMHTPAYRFSYEDLLSGNFSISLQLFKKVNGFDETLRCREDYELGIRLIKAKAKFVFVPSAWGYHRDEVTNLNRSLRRKQQEGKADVQLWRLHPNTLTILQEYSLNKWPTFVKSWLVFLIIYFPKLTDFTARLLERCTKLAEWMHLRITWNAINIRLHNYWYLRGLLDELQTMKNLKAYLAPTMLKHIQPVDLSIDLEKGIEAAETYLDQFRPSSLQLCYNKKIIGTIPYKEGSEELCGKHLRYLLATEFSYPLLRTLSIQDLTAKAFNETPELKKPLINCSNN